MLRDLKDVRKIRKNLSLTQADLAKMADVSQSLIAKIECGSATPSYDKGKAVLEALDNVIRSRGSGLCAGDIHTINVIHIGPEDNVGTALQLMKDNAVSQLPVIQNDIVMGGLTERCLLNRFDKLDREWMVRDIMEDPFPIIPATSSIELVRELLLYYPSVLTTVDGNIKGITTKADLLEEILDNR